MMKIVWDWGTYWAIPTLLFINEGYTNFEVLKNYSSTSKKIGFRFATLNEQIQDLFSAWSKYEFDSHSEHRINIFDLKFMSQFHFGLKKKHSAATLISQIELNLSILEDVAAELFRLVCTEIHGTPLNMKVNPYEISLHDTKEELLQKSLAVGSLSVNEAIRADLSVLWLHTTKKTISNAHT